MSSPDAYGDLVGIGADLLAQPAELVEDLALGLGELARAVEQFFAVTISQAVVAILRAVAARIADLRQPALVVSEYLRGSASTYPNEFCPPTRSHLTALTARPLLADSVQPERLPNTMAFC